MFKLKDIELDIDHYQYTTSVRISDDGLVYKPLRLKLTGHTNDILLIKKIKSFEYMLSLGSFITKKESFINMRIMQFKYEENMEDIYQYEIILYGDKWWNGFDKAICDENEQKNV